MSETLPPVHIIVEGSATVSERDRERYVELVKAIVAASVQRQGCIKFSVAEDIGQRNLFHLTELWTDQASLDASRFGDENTAMLRELAPLDVQNRRVVIHHVSRSETD
jgi:quinol monooxygenase YgiN